VPSNDSHCRRPWRARRLVSIGGCVCSRDVAAAIGESAIPTPASAGDESSAGVVCAGARRECGPSSRPHGSPAVHILPEPRSTRVSAHSWRLRVPDVSRSRTPRGSVHVATPRAAIEPSADRLQPGAGPSVFRPTCFRTSFFRHLRPCLRSDCGVANMTDQSHDWAVTVLRCRHKPF
jgi:hypothetical protein